MPKLPVELATLQVLGYIVCPLNLPHYRVHGQVGYINVWPVYQMWKRHYASDDEMAETYKDCDELVKIVRSRLQPYETKTDDEREAYDAWRAELGAVMACYPQIAESRLATETHIQ